MIHMNLISTIFEDYKVRIIDKAYLPKGSKQRISAYTWRRN